MAETGDQSRALALSSGLGRTALVFDDNDVVDLLRIAIEREGGQSAFDRHHGINRNRLNTILTGKRVVGSAIAESLSGFAKRTSTNCVAKIPRAGEKSHFIPTIAFRSYFWRA
jgi:hypothetical protein